MFELDKNLLLADTMESSTISSGNDDVWIVVEDEEPELEGMTLVADRESGDIVSLSSRSCSNEQKRRSMPSLKEYPALKVVDLHNYRHMIYLHESIGDLPVLQRLILSRCDLLQKLPASIGSLDRLVEVSYIIIHSYTFKRLIITKVDLITLLIFCLFFIHLHHAA
jgi:hypothetical protein